MIPKDLIEYVSEKLDIYQKELIEKDLLLHEFLIELDKTDFTKKFAFKGGTCLIKCYLGYYRFSEDLDFSWINQEYFQQKSQGQIRKNLSEEINRLMEIFYTISNNLELDFKKQKDNRRYLEFGGSNRFITFKFWYKSHITGLEQFFKLQINFVELFKYSIKTSKVGSVIENIPKKEAIFLFPDIQPLISELKIKTYDLKEIMLEKSRAILTRKDIKVRDFLDLYFILKKLKVQLEDYERDIIEKIVFMLKYEKYAENIKTKETSLKEISIKEIEKLILVKIDDNFEVFLKDTKSFFIKIAQKITYLITSK